MSDRYTHDQLPGGFYYGEMVIIHTGSHKGHQGRVIGSCMGTLITLDLLTGGRIDVDPHNIEDLHAYRALHFSMPARPMTTLLVDESVL